MYYQRNKTESLLTEKQQKIIFFRLSWYFSKINLNGGSIPYISIVLTSHKKKYLFTLKTLAFFISLVKTGNILLCITLLGLKDKSALIQNAILTPPEK